MWGRIFTPNTNKVTLPYNQEDKVMKQNTKDWIQYTSAIALIASAIVMAFTSFMTINDITSGINAYIGIAISGGLAIFGVAAYMVNQVTQFKTEIRKELDEMKKGAKDEKN